MRTGGTVIGLTLCLLSVPFGSATASNRPRGLSAQASPTAPAAPATAPRLPIAFEPNRGQTDARVAFVARGMDFGLFLTPDEAVLALSAKDALRMRYRGASAGARVSGERKLAGTANHLRGPDPSAWRTGVETFAAVRYENLYPGVGLVFYGGADGLEYDFEVAPGADLSAVRLAFEGADAVSIDEGGDLVLDVGGREVRHRRPTLRQSSDKRAVAGRFVLRGETEVGFDAGEYDRAEPLVVDPVISFASYLGGNDPHSADERPGDMTVDASGAIYLVGSTRSIDFPVVNAFDGTFESSPEDFSGDAFVAKLDPFGSALLYSTFLGGELDDEATGIAVDASGATYMVGETASAEFPTLGALDAHLDGESDAFVVKLTPAGNALAYSTFLGGSATDRATNVALDQNGRAYVVGRTGSTNFPTAAPLQPVSHGFDDGFVVKIAATGASLLYSTYLGGSDSEGVDALALDASGAIYVTGITGSADFPLANAIDASFAGWSDTFIAKLTPPGDALVYSTYLGGTGYDYPRDIAVDAAGNAYVAGTTHAEDFPTVNAIDATFGGVRDGYLTKLTPAGTAIAYSTYIGGTETDSLFDVEVDASGAAYLMGSTESSDFPTANAYDASLSGESDAVVAKVAPDGASLLFSSYFGGAGADYVWSEHVDATGAVYVFGRTTSQDLPTVDAFDATWNGGNDCFLAKFAPNAAALAFSTYIGGGESVGATTDVTATAVDPSGALYVSGWTEAFDFPVAGGYDTSYNSGADAFVAKVASDGASLVYSTFVGGSGVDVARDMTIDANGHVFVTGWTGIGAGFPTTPGAYDTTANGSTDAFLFELSSGGDRLEFSTMLGGAGPERATAIARDPAGSLYVVGTTSSSDYPTANAFDATFNGNVFDYDIFLTKLAPAGDALVYSTFLGTDESDTSSDVAVDAAGAAYVLGDTRGKDFPTVGAIDPDGPVDSSFTKGTVTKFAPSGGSLAFSTYLGGTGQTSAYAIAVDAAGRAVVTGFTQGLGLPGLTTIGPTDGNDAFVIGYDSTGSSYAFATVFGGTGSDIAVAVVVDAAGNVYVAGSTNSTDFPVSGAYDTTYGGNDALGYDVFVTKLNPSASALLYSTYLGGPERDVASAVAVDAAGAAYVVGETDGAFPTTPGTIQATFPGSRSGFFAKLPVLPVGGDTPGIYDGPTGAWFLRDTNAPGPADALFGYGPPSLVALSGDWDGDGRDTPGLYNSSTGAFFLRNAASSGPADLVFVYGPSGLGWVPLSGDYDGDGVDTIGLYDPATGTFFLKNTNASGGADLAFGFGAGGPGLTPLTGDWNGDGLDTVGLYTSAGVFFLRNANSAGPANVAFSYGPAGAVPLRGDWDADGRDTVGVYVPATGAWFLRNANAPGGADLVFAYGPPGVTPLSGDWNGQ